MEENVIKRFGDLTLMNACKNRFAPTIMMCQFYKFNQSFTINFAELDSIFDLYMYNMDDMEIEKNEYNIIFEGDAIVIETHFGNIECNHDDMRDLMKYVRENYIKVEN